MKRKPPKKAKPRVKKGHWSPWHYLVFVGIVLVLYVFLHGNYGFIRYMQLQKQRQQLVNDIKELKKKQDSLEKEVDQLLHNYRYIEKILREKYKMGKKGEKIYFMVSPEQIEKNNNH